MWFYNCDVIFHGMLVSYILNLLSSVFVQVELTSLLDAAQETETKMVEMSALNHLMSTHVLQQAQQIEFLYDQVCFLFFILVWFIQLACIVYTRTSLGITIFSNK